MNERRPTPATRLLTLLELLQAHDRTSGPDLAARLGVDVRTLRRYVGQLEALGIPVLAERGRGGGYALVRGFKLPPMVFNEDEGLALSLGLLAASRLDAATAVAADTARAKLERVMPAALRRRVRALAGTVQLHGLPAAAAGAAGMLRILASAAQERQPLRMVYRGPDGRASTRLLSVHGVALRDGHWYAVAHCHLRGGLRIFRVDRIVEAEALPGAAMAPPPGFDPAAHLAHVLSTLLRAHAPVVRLRSQLAAARAHFIDTIGVFEPEPGGWVRLRAQVDDLDWFARQLCRLDCDFDIVSPPCLRERVAAHARRLLQQVQPHAPQGQAALDTIAA